MNVAELFAGVGGFRLGLEKSDRTYFKTVWMNQWEPSKKQQEAFNCYKDRFLEGEKNNEDIGEVDVKNLKDKDIELIVGGFPCFAKGTYITTREGIKRIEDVKKGDKVLTHKNRFKEVVKTMKRKKKGLYDLKVQGSPYTEITEEHPVYIRKKERVWNKDRKKYDLKWTEPFWEEVKNLKKGVHYVGMSINKNGLNKENLTNEEIWLLGRYVADGYIQDSHRRNRKNTSKNRVIFCIGKGKADEFKKKVSEYKVTLVEERTVIRGIITDKRLMGLCKRLGRGAENKKIAGYIIDLPVKKLKIFLDGYMSGDGSKTGTLRRASTVSKELVYGLGQVIHKVYKRANGISFSKTTDKTIIEERYVNQLDVWSIQYREGENVQSHGYYLDEMMWMPIKNIQYKEGWEGIVYNFEVEEDNSYVANNLTVHNCQDYSVARTSKGKQGIEGKKGVLFWEIIRLVEELKPNYLLLENVDRLLITPSNQRGRDFAVMLAAFRDLGYYVEWRVINAALYGGSQKRKRVFIYVVKKEHLFADKMNKEHKYDLLYKKGFFAPKFPVRKSLFKLNLKGRKLDKDIVKVSDTFEGNFQKAGAMIEGYVYTSNVKEDIESYTSLGDILEENVPDNYYLTEEEEKKFRYLRGKKEIERETEDGFKYLYKEGKMSEVDELHIPSRTILTSEGSVSRTTHIIRDEKGKRYLTPKECERLNNFPDDWTEGMTERMRYFCMGNALDVNLIKRMGDRLKEIEQENK